RRRSARRMTASEEALTNPRPRKAHPLIQVAVGEREVPMPANVYESLIMLDTSKLAGDLPAVQQQLHAIMERNHAEILASRPWDERRLSYPIRGQKKALFYLLYFKSTGENLVTIEHDFALNETVMRAMV